MEFATFEINYKARNAISQFLADFIADWTKAPPNTLVPELVVWVMHFDRSEQVNGSIGGWCYPQVTNRRRTQLRLVDSLQCYQ
jgi:hypothetical protein